MSVQMQTNRIRYVTLIFCSKRFDVIDFIFYWIL